MTFTGGASMRGVVGRVLLALVLTCAFAATSVVVSALPASAAAEKDSDGDSIPDVVERDAWRGVPPVTRVADTVWMRDGSRVKIGARVSVLLWPRDRRPLWWGGSRAYYLENGE